LYQVVADRVKYWNKDNNCGLVVGATHPEQLKELRELAGDMPLLIPGVGAQGGSLEEAVLYGTDDFRKVAVINVGRSVLYASGGSDFDQRARQEVAKLNAVVTTLRYGDKSSDTPSQSQAEPQSTDIQTGSPQADQTIPEGGPPAPDQDPPGNQPG
jgi:hypothetical protein